MFCRLGHETAAGVFSSTSKPTRTDLVSYARILLDFWALFDVKEGSQVKRSLRDRMANTLSQTCQFRQHTNGSLRGIRLFLSDKN